MEQQVGCYLLMYYYNQKSIKLFFFLIHHIGGEGNSFHSLHFYSSRYCLTEAAKTMQLHISSSY